MRKSNELLIIVEDIAPSLKSSEKLFIVGVIMDECLAAYKEGGTKTLNMLKDQVGEEDEDEEYDRASSNAGCLI